MRRASQSHPDHDPNNHFQPYAAHNIASAALHVALASPPQVFLALVAADSGRVDAWYAETLEEARRALRNSISDASRLPTAAVALGTAAGAQPSLLDHETAFDSPYRIAVSTDPEKTPVASPILSVHEVAQQLAAIHSTLSHLRAFRVRNRLAYEEVLRLFIRQQYPESAVSDMSTLLTDHTRMLLDILTVFSETGAQALDASIKRVQIEYLALTGRELHVPTATPASNVAASPARTRAVSIRRERRATGISSLRTGAVPSLRKSTNRSIFHPMDIATLPKLKEPHWIWRYIPRNTISLLLSLIAFAILLRVQIFSSPEQQNCLAMLVFVLMLWSTEAMPLYATALMVPLLVVVLRIMRTPHPPIGPDPPLRLTAKQAAPAIFATMFSPMMMLLLGGFSLASALEKYEIARMVATAVLRRAGTRPSRIMLATMSLACVMSTVLTNVTAPILCFSLIQPIIQRLPAHSPQARALILGIALASNIGGLMSPIASPQSLIGSETMRPSPSWPQFFAAAVPVAIVSITGIWAWLLVVYKPDRDDAELALPVPEDTECTATDEEQGLAAGETVLKSGRYHVGHPAPGRLVRFCGQLTPQQWYVIAVAMISTLLWCTEPIIDGYVGHLGVVSVFPILALFGTGILNKDDFNGFLWTVMALAMGGVALGKAVDSCGLLAVLADGVRLAVQGMSLWSVAWVFCIVMLIVSTFISHTVAALIILPVVYEVGAALPNPHPQILVFVTMMCASAGMGLPISGFPNMNAVMLEDASGKAYLSTKDFVIGGVPASILATIAIGTLGYGVGLGMGF